MCRAVKETRVCASEECAPNIALTLPSKADLYRFEDDTVPVLSGADQLQWGCAAPGIPGSVADEDECSIPAEEDWQSFFWEQQVSFTPFALGRKPQQQPQPQQQKQQEPSTQNLLQDIVEGSRVLQGRISISAAGPDCLTCALAMQEAAAFGNSSLQPSISMIPAAAKAADQWPVLDEGHRSFSKPGTQLPYSPASSCFDNSAEYWDNSRHCSSPLARLDVAGLASTPDACCCPTTPLLRTRQGAERLQHSLWNMATVCPSAEPACGAASPAAQLFQQLPAPAFVLMGLL